MGNTGALFPGGCNYWLLLYFSYSSCYCALKYCLVNILFLSLFAHKQFYESTICHRIIVPCNSLYIHITFIFFSNNSTHYGEQVLMKCYGNLPLEETSFNTRWKIGIRGPVWSLPLGLWAVAMWYLQKGQRKIEEWDVSWTALNVMKNNISGNGASYFLWFAPKQEQDITFPHRIHFQVPVMVIFGRMIDTIAFIPLFTLITEAEWARLRHGTNRLGCRQGTVLDTAWMVWNLNRAGDD